MKEQLSLQDQLSKLVQSGALETPVARVKPLRKLKATALPANPTPAPDLVPGTSAELVVEETTPGLPEPRTQANTTDKLKAQLARTELRFKGLHGSQEQADGREHLQAAVKSAMRLHDLVIASTKGQRSAEATAARQSATWLANSSRSLLDAHEASDLQAHDIMQIRRQARAHIETVEALVAGGEQAVEATRLEDLPAAYFNKYRKFGAKLPTASSMSQKGHRFTTIRVPVIALFSKIVTARDLESAGFDVSDDGGYITFLDQEVWCINTAALKESSWEGDEAGYLQKLVNQYRQRTGKVAEFMGLESKQRIGHPNAKGVSFYWMMSRNEARGLSSAAGAAVLQEWGFAF